MEGINPSTGQSQCRSKFKDAVSFAQTIMADTSLKTHWSKKLKVKNRLFNALVKYHLTSR